MPNVRPNASQWNILHVGYGRVGLALFIPFFSRSVPNANTVFSGIWTLYNFTMNKLLV